MELKIENVRRDYMLYHGTNIGELKYIKANSKSHTSGKNVAYFTEDRCYALVCCRERESNFVTMGLREDGKQHYFERFPDQLRILYQGKKGYLYLPESTDHLVNTKGRTWESENDVCVSRFIIVDDVYAEIMKEAASGNVVIHRYSDIDPVEQKIHANHIKENLADEGEKTKAFYMEHFSAIWD